MNRHKKGVMPEITREMYKAIKKYDRQQFAKFCTDLYAFGYEDGRESVPGVELARAYLLAEDAEAEFEAIRELIAKFDSKFITAKNAGIQHDAIIGLINELGELPEGVLTESDKGVKNGVTSLDSSGRLS